MPRSTDFKALSVFALITLLAATASATDIPQDQHGLPLWVPAVFPDFPVRIVLDDRAALDALLAEVPVASFVPEQIGFHGNGLVEFTPRVTETELRALERAGYVATRIPDIEKQVQRAMERRWREQVELGGEVLRRGEREQYHTYAQLGQILQDAETDHPAICAVDVAGQSVQGRNLYRIRITDNPHTEEAEPEVRYGANMHGNEKISMEMAIYLIEYLTDNYDQPGYEDVTHLVDEYDLWIMPLQNPDGHVANSRYNAHGVDLNRNYPVPDGSIGDDGTWVEEPETVVMMNWSESARFVTGLNGHSGILCMIYPWTYTSEPPPNEDALYALCEEYAYYNEPMWNHSWWYHGIVAGADYGIIKGPENDWSYYFTGCLQVAVEFSDDYAPPQNQLDEYWDDNRESFMHWFKAARYGVNGVVTSLSTGLPLAATVEVAGIAMPAVTDPDCGDYWRPLVTGSYDLTFSAVGHETVTITDVATTWGVPTVLNVALPPEGGTGTPAAASPTRLVGAHPNPFNPKTALRFELRTAGPARLTVIDVAGRVVRRLVDGPLEAGAHAAQWDGTDEAGRPVAGGIYLVRFEAGGFSDGIKLVLMK
jgi:hypothetical protein